MSFVSVAAQMAIQAAIQAAMGKSANEIGREAGKTALSGAIGGAIGGGLGGATTKGNTASQGIGGAIGGAAANAAFGEDPLQGALYGGIAGAARGYSQGPNVGSKPLINLDEGEWFPEKAPFGTFGSNLKADLPTGFKGSWDRYNFGVGEGQTLLPDISQGAQDAAISAQAATKSALEKAGAASALDKALQNKITGEPIATSFDTKIPTNQYVSNTPFGQGSVGGASGASKFNEFMGPNPAIANAAAPNVTNISVPAATKAPVEEGMFSGENGKLKALAAAAALGGGAYMLSGNTGVSDSYVDPNAAAKEPLYPISLSPDFKAPPDIKRSKVPRYYSKEGGIIQEQGYAEGGSAVDTSGPMNPFAEMGVAHAQQQMQATQAQMPQQGIPRGYAGGGNIEELIKAGLGKELGPGVAQALGTTKGTVGTNDAFMDQVKAQMSMQMQGPQAAQAAIPAVPQQQAQAPTPMNPAQQPITTAAGGGLMGISDLGGYAHGGIPRLTSGPGDGVSDSIPAEIGSTGKQPARLADGEFVVPARIVSELGNGSTEAGARELQGMMDRVQKRRKKTVGKGKIAVDSKARKVLPA
jgi:hypothetical protein